MLKAPSAFIIVFIAVSVILILAMAIFISMIVYRYQQRQNIYYKEMEALRTSHENTLLQSQLEMQEHTFQTISREIHDNIGQKLTLAKLHLNTLNFNDMTNTRLRINDSIDIIGASINGLTDLSRSKSSEIVVHKGLINALEYETAQLAKSGIFVINFSVTGSPVFVDTDTGLVVFRMAQEALNNIVKHANAPVIDINLHYTDDLLTVQINDNGRGFNIAETNHGTGLRNIKKRASMLKGNLTVISSPGTGTKIKIEIPLT